MTPYVDGELGAAERDVVESHLRACPPCHSRAVAERSVRELLRGRREALCGAAAPSALRARCARPPQPAVAWRARLGSVALAASLVLVVGGAFVYQLTERSGRVIAAELTADHVKCFAVNDLLGTQQAAATVKRLLVSKFDWHAELPPEGADGLELVGARQCLYGEGRVAHIMFRHAGHGVSVFMLPKTTRPGQFVDVMGHEAVIWSVGGRTFVLIAKEPRAEVERMASIVQAAMR